MNAKCVMAAAVCNGILCDILILYLCVDLLCRNVRVILHFTLYSLYWPSRVCYVRMTVLCVYLALFLFL